MSTAQDIKRAWQSLPSAERGEVLRWLQSEATATDVPGIRKTPGVCGGDACVRNTRLAVWTIEELRAQGADDARLRELYPFLSPADLAAAAEYATRHRAEIDARRAEEQA